MIEINNLTNFSVDKRFFLAVAKKVLTGENRGLENLSIAFVSPEEIQKINKTYRGKDKPTDVLSFEKKAGFKEDFLEVIICPEVVGEKEPGLASLDEKIAKVLIHGILHSIGYDHERSGEEEQKMTERELYYAKNI